MIRLTWLQFRAQAVTAAAALAAVVVVLGVSAPHRALDTGASHWFYMAGIVVLYLTPAVIGIFWGAPLISRELETGTFRLAWTQSISRTRWLAVKLGLTGLASMATAGLLSLMVTWWSSSMDQRNPLGGYRLSALLFGARDLAPVGSAAFAVALGVTIGLLARRVVPAIAITLAIFVAVQVAVPLWVRPYLISPVRTVSPLNVSAINAVGSSFPGNSLFVGAAVNIPGAWVYSNQVTAPDGSTFLGLAPRACTSGSAKFLPSGQTNACNAALGRLHLRQVIVYQPGNRYWAFQWSETAIFLVFALLLTGFCIWWTSRQLSP
ncbi:MAG: ABC transporter permease [Streptosporangiaceae bacterium]|jgi:ABC-type transport system involved in multi-copper enzyme maturation permease subunit